MLSLGMPYWSLSTTILYVLMGIIPMWTLYNKQYKNNYKGNNSRLLLWFFIWTIFGGYRVVGYGMGGADAGAYVLYFQNCLNPQSLMSGAMSQYDSNIGFRWFNHFLRFFSADERFYLVVTSAIIAAVPIIFIKYFRQSRESCIPFFLCVFWFIRGFCTIRSHLSICAFMLAVILLLKKKKNWAILLGAFSVLLHPMGAIYFPLLVLLYIKEDFSINMRKVILLILSLFLVVVPMKQLFLQNIDIFGDYSSHYEWYASSSNENFFSNAWKIAFEQLLLLLCMYVNRNNLHKYMSILDGNAKRSFLFIYNVCIYDFLLIPFCYALNIWRGYEVCYIPRLIMWAIIVYIGATKLSKNFKWIYLMVVSLMFLGWFIQRTYAESFWLETGLMPYAFAPLMN